MTPRVATPVSGPYVVLDDDPTGTQAVREVPVLLAWDERRLRRAAALGRRAIHLMTNIRAVPADEAYTITLNAAATALSALPGAELVLRGDSTLRGHVGEEYRALREAAFGDRAPVLLAVPALPEAGRVTRGGVHWLVSGEGERHHHLTALFRRLHHRLAEPAERAGAVDHRRAVGE